MGSKTWNIDEYLAEKLNLKRRVSQNLVSLFEQENTVPFIARYRKKETEDLCPESIRSAYIAFEEAKNIKGKIETVKRQVEKQGKSTPELVNLFNNAKSTDEIEALFAPFKGESKQSLAAKARALGLEESALNIIDGQTVSLEKLLNATVPGLKSVEEVQRGLQHIIADYLLKQVDTQNYIRQLAHELPIKLQSSLSKAASKSPDEETQAKYKDYFKFDSFVRAIRPHQVLALNRGEHNKILSLKVVVPPQGLVQFQKFVNKRFLGKVTEEDKILKEQSIDDCYKRLAEPQICRLIRSWLSKEGEKAAVEVFTTNLRQLILTPPLKNCAILGVDPGFKHGCKCALISSSNVILDTGVFWLPDSRKNQSNDIPCPLLEGFLKLMEKCKAKELKIAIGNGTGCRQAEKYISKFIENNQLLKQFLGNDEQIPLTVVYCIVNESGSSVYSVSDLAQKELPNLDPNLRSAVSIARRLQDPLAEIVKMDPKNMGVGMYQHDITEKLLKQTVDLVVQECVSFVGVDVNTCSLELLQRVAGLNRTQSSNIIEFRQENGAFFNREQLLQVKGVAKKSFQQCAGFVKIFATDASTPLEMGEPQRKKRKVKACTDTNPLDSTTVHPESYGLAKTLIYKVGCSLKDVGTAKLHDELSKMSMLELSQLSTSEDDFTINEIYNALMKPLFYDMRQAFDGPVFRQSVNDLSKLTSGQELTGVVRNVTHFGAFVDVGVGQDGLLHKSGLVRGVQLSKLQVGSRVEVSVESVDYQRKRIALRLIKMCSI